MKPFEIKTSTLKKLIEQTKIKLIELPSFQREYTWDIEKQKGLIASIFCGIPASSFLVFNGDTTFEVRDIGLRGSQLRQSSPTASQLLDGQQRLTTIYSVFSNIYDSSTPPENYFPKIRNRWFINLLPIDNSLDLFNLQSFKFNSNKISKESSTEIFIDTLTVKPADDNKLNCFYKKSDQELNDYCIENNFLPLFFLDNNLDEIRTILSAIANNHKTKLQTRLANQNPTDELIKILIQNNPNSKFENYNTEREFCEIELTKLVNNWVDKIRDYFSNFLEHYEQSIVELNNIDKIVEAFYIINTSGVKLTTFDLLCAKLNKLKLRALIENELQIEHQTKLRDNSKLKIKASSILQIIDSKKDIKDKYYQFFTQACGLYYILITKQQTIDTLSPDDIKSQKILNINFNQINEVDIKQIASIVNKTFIFLATQCALRSIDKITNDLALISIFSLGLKNPTIFDKKNDLDLIKKFYFQRLLLGIYNSNQNTNCIDDCKLLNNIYKESKNPKKPKPYTKLFNEAVQYKILRNDFICFENVNNWDKNNLVNQSGKVNLLYFIEAFTINTSGLADFCTPTTYIKYFEQVEIHHVIPIGSIKNNYLEAYKSNSRLKHHRINSVLNLATIKKETNRKISDLTVEKYMSHITNPGIFGSHLLDDKFKTRIDAIPENVTTPVLTLDEKTLLELYEIRFNRIKELACQVLIIN